VLLELLHIFLINFSFVNKDLWQNFFQIMDGLSHLLNEKWVSLRFIY